MAKEMLNSNSKKQDNIIREELYDVNDNDNIIKDETDDSLLIDNKDKRKSLNEEYTSK